MFSPGLRQVAFAIGRILLIFFLLALGSMVLVGLYRLATPVRNTRAMTTNAFASSVGAPEQNSNDSEPEADGPPNHKHGNI